MSNLGKKEKRSKRSSRHVPEGEYPTEGLATGGDSAAVLEVADIEGGDDVFQQQQPPQQQQQQGGTNSSTEGEEAAPLLPPSTTTIAALPTQSPRSMTRAEALAQLKRGGAGGLQRVRIDAPVPRHGDPGAMMTDQTYKGGTSNYGSVGQQDAPAFSPAEKGGGRDGDGGLDESGNPGGEATLPTPEEDEEKRQQQQQRLHRSNTRNNDRDDGGHGRTSSPPTFAKHITPRVPSEDRINTNNANGVSDAALEDATSLPRMLRMQRAFETNMSKLYSFCATHVTEWPALCVEWIPDRKFVDPERDYSLQYLALGTQTIRGAPNQVRVMEVAVPDDTDAGAMYGLYGDDDIGARGENANNSNGNGNTDPDGAEIEVDPGKLFRNVRGHFRCEQAITLNATVLKLRAMPTETNIMACTTGSGFIGVYNLVQDQREDEDGYTVPDAILTGHKMGGFGLSWNPVKIGYLASGADDGFVNYWDISHRITVDLRDDDAEYAGGGIGGSGAPDLSGAECEPIQKMTSHRDIVTDVSWHCSQGHLLASSSLDGDARIWDIRTNSGATGSSSITLREAHIGGATAAQFHPVGAFQLATAGVSGELCFWDIRRPNDPLLTMTYHGRAVTGVRWAPFNEPVIASYGEDGRVVVWDLAKTSLPLEYSADGLAPPEVSFVHIGHLGVVTDFSWCNGSSGGKDDWLMASTDSMNGVHVYKPRESIVRDYVPRQLW